MNLVNRAYTDLKTAKRNLAEDEECAYNYAYNAMMRSGMALMASEGFRPEIKDKHLTIVKFASSILGDRFKTLVNNYDFMRRKRHRFMRYAHLAPSHKVQAVAMLEQLHDNYMTIQANAEKKHPACELSA